MGIAFYEPRLIESPPLEEDVFHRSRPSVLVPGDRGKHESPSKTTFVSRDIVKVERNLVRWI